MIDVKDIARKVTTGCPHSTPVLVPCTGCVETNLSVYQDRIRESVKKEFREEWNAMEAEVKRLADEISRMTATFAIVKANAAKIDGINKQLVERAKELVKENNDLKAAAAADRAYKAHTVKGAA